MLYASNPIMLTSRFDAALAFATDLHRPQHRKGGNNIPYLGHLLAVTALVIEDGGSEDEAIAALLHDSIEDRGDDYPGGGRPALRAYITAHFGPAVLAIINACTDDEGFEKGAATTPEQERALWLERKHQYHAAIAHKSPQALRVTAADKVHNAESILDSYEAAGPAVWLRFRTKSRQDQIDVYRSLSAAISHRNDSLPPDQRTRLPKRLARAVALMENLPA